MRFPPQFLDEIRARVPVSQVVSRKVALKKKGREYSGLSPFKVEKTPSFFVNDQKGFYHCFASGEHGDIFTFVMKTEGLAFPEAVERLAAEAGLPMPVAGPRDVEAADARQRLYDVMEASARFFEECLKSQAGTEARRYIEKRGLSRAALGEFRIGYAPGSRSALKEHLGKAGFKLEEMTLSGMLISGDDIPVAYDRFRHRVMFPITDLKGRVIAFGGRALDPEAPAKYLNSPETPLFHKGHVLFNAQRARGPAHDKGRIIAVEGYMDVVSLSEAGFKEAVAPLGTALTEDQVRLLWRMSPEPILCFDGDGAGRKAAFRAIDVLLPHLKPGLSATFAFLPDGLDPDDLCRQQGPEAMEEVLARTRPLAAMLFEREWASGDWSTPERKARLEHQLRGLVDRIGDASVRAHYAREIAGRLAAAWGPAAPARGGEPSRGDPGARPRGGYAASGAAGQQRSAPWQSQRPPGRWSGPPGNRPGYPAPRAHASSALLASRLVAGDSAAPPYREALLLRALVNHPWLIDDYAEAIADLPLASAPLARLRDVILSLHATDNSLDTSRLTSQLEKAGLAGQLRLVQRAITHKCDRFAEADAANAEVEAGWRHALALHDRQVGLKRALDAAERSWHENGSEEALARIYDLQQQLNGLNLHEADGPSGSGGELG